MIKRNLLTALIIIILLIAYAIFYPKNDNQTEDLVASGHPAWPPIMYQKGDQIVGAGTEIVSMIFSDLGIKSTFKFSGSWDEVQKKTKEGSIDVLVAAYKTKERETYMDYSIAYTVDPVSLIVKKGKTFSYGKWDDLIGKKGVMTIGDSYGQGFDNFIKEKLTLENVKTPKEAFDLVINGEVDYFVYALYSAQDYIFKNKLSDKIEILPKYISTEDFYITISKKSSFAKFLPQINKSIEKYIKDGTIKKIIEKHKNSLWNKE